MKIDTKIPITPSTGNLVNKDVIMAIIVALVATASVLLSFDVAISTPELIFFPSLLLKNDIHNLRHTDKISDIIVIILNLSSSGCIILEKEFFNSSKPTIKIIIAMVRVERYSILP